MNILLMLADAPAVTGNPGGTIDSFFTLATFGTLAGATGVVYVLCGTIQSVFNYSPKWLALVVSIAVSYIGVIFVTKDETSAKYFIALLNGCLIYSTATGANTLAAPKPAPSIKKDENAAPKDNKVKLDKDVENETKPSRNFSMNWWHK